MDHDASSTWSAVVRHSAYYGIVTSEADNGRDYDARVFNDEAE